MKKSAIEKKYEVYERHFEKAKANAKQYFKSGSFGVYRKLNITQFEELYNEFYKGNKNYARQIIYDFNKESRYSDAQAEVAAKMLYRFITDTPPENLQGILSAEDMQKIKNAAKGKTDEEVINKLKSSVLRGKFYDELEKVYAYTQNSPGATDVGTVEYSYLYGSS